MILTYNEQGLHDVLLCIFRKQDDHLPIDVEKKNDIILLTQENQLIGINIEKSKEKFENLPNGVQLAEDMGLQQEVIAYLQKNGIDFNETEGTLKQQFVVGYVKEKNAHPDSEKLSVCQVDVGTETLQIVCGAVNVSKEQKVVVAKPYCMMPTGLIIEPSILRKVASNGMICSAKELNLPSKFRTPGILVLDKNAQVGELFFNYFQEEMVRN